jgi:hypothetical protein
MPKHKELNINRFYGKKPPVVTTEYDPDHLWDMPWFITYRELVEKTLKELGKLVTLPQLRKVMGDEYKDRYILDAFEASHHVLRVPTLPLEQFVWIERVKPVERPTWNGVSGSPKNVTADLGLQPRVLA